jgi:hypothetical protein
LFFNKFVRARIKREKINVITDLLAITNKLPECQTPAKKNQDEIISVSKSTEPGFAKLYLELFENLGQSVFMTMAELKNLTGLSKNTLSNVLNKKIRNPPKWLKAKHINKKEGYELWIDPSHGSVDRAQTLTAGLQPDSGFLESLGCPTKVIPGRRNQWVFSAIIHYKFHGFTAEETRSEISRQASLIPTHKESDSFKKIPQMVSQIFGTMTETFAIKDRDNLPQVLTRGYFHKVKKQQQPGGPELGSSPFFFAFTRKQNQKVAIAFRDGEVIAQANVSGSGLIPQLQAIQSLFACVGEVGQVIIRGNSMLQDHPVTLKFEAFHKIKLSFEERTAQDVKLLKDFREFVPEGNSQAAPRRVTEVRECFSFPDIKSVKVRLDGHFEYQKAFYWLGEGWSGIRLEVLASSEKIEAYVYGKNELVRSFERLQPGEQSFAERKIPWERALDSESIYRKKARKVGPSFDSLVHESIENGQGVIHTGRVMGYLGLLKVWPLEQLEAVALHCLESGRRSQRYFRSCLETGHE